MEENESMEGLETEGLPPESTLTAEGAADVQGSAALAENGSGNAELQRRAEELAVQAELLQRVTGCDMMALFQTDEGMRGKVVSGEWDFVDAYAAKRKEEKPPQLARGGSMGGMGLNVAGMNEGQFGRLNEMLAQGGCVRF